MKIKLWKARIGKHVAKVGRGARAGVRDHGGMRGVVLDSGRLGLADEMIILILESALRLYKN